MTTKHPFIVVWGLPELRELIRSFMWPGKKSAKWDDYEDLVAASRYGYNALIAANWNKFTEKAACLPVAARYGQLSTVKLIERLMERDKNFEAGSNAISGGSLAVYEYYAPKVNLFTRENLKMAIASGNMEICVHMLSSNPLHLWCIKLVCKANLTLLRWIVDNKLNAEIIHNSELARMVMERYNIAGLAAIGPVELGLLRLVHELDASAITTSVVALAMVSNTLEDIVWMFKADLDFLRLANTATLYDRVDILEWIMLNEHHDIRVSVLMESAIRAQSIEVLIWLLSTGAATLSKSHISNISLNYSLPQLEAIDQVSRLVINVGVLEDSAVWRPLDVFKWLCDRYDHELGSPNLAVIANRGIPPENLVYLVKNHGRSLQKISLWDLCSTKSGHLEDVVFALIEADLLLEPSNNEFNTMFTFRRDFSANLFNELKRKYAHL